MCKGLNKYEMSIKREIFKRGETEILEVKSTKQKTSLAEFNGRFEQEKEGTSEYKDKTVKLIQYEDQKEKRIKKNGPEGPVRYHHLHITRANICIMGVPEEERKRQKKIFQK